MKILALGGCGDMGRMAVAVLLESPKVTSITIADRDLNLARRYVEITNSEKLSAVQIDVTQKHKLVELISTHDIVVSTVGPYFRFGKLIIEACIEAKKPSVDICDDWKPMQEILNMSDQAKEVGISCILGIGASPGVLNLLAALASSEFDDIEELITAWGVKLMKEGPRPRYYYKKKKFLKKIGAPPARATAALVHLFYEAIGKVPTFKDGKFVEIEALTPAGILKFPGFADTEIFNIGHPEPVMLPRTIKANTIKNVMFLGPTATELVRTLKKKVSNKEMTMEEASLEFEKVEESYRKPKMILKLYKEIKNHPPILCVNATGIKDGQEKKIAMGLSRAPYDEMAGITGVPLAIAALMLIDGKISKKGILTPEEAINPEEFFDQLAIYCGKNLTGKDIIIKEEFI